MGWRVGWGVGGACLDLLSTQKMGRNCCSLDASIFDLTVYTPVFTLWFSSTSCLL